MGRARLMEQQRAKRNALKAKKKTETKKQSDISKYGSGSKKGVTRDASKDASKTPLVLSPNKPAEKKPSKAPVTSSKPSKPAPKATPTKPASKGPSSGVYGSFMPSNPKLKSQNKKQTGRQRINTEVAANSGGRMTSSGAKSKPQPKRNRRGRKI